MTLAKYITLSYNDPSTVHTVAGMRMSLPHMGPVHSDSQVGGCFKNCILLLTLLGLTLAPLPGIESVVFLIPVLPVLFWPGLVS